MHRVETVISFLDSNACEDLGTHVNWLANRLHNIILCGVKSLSIEQLIDNTVYWLRWVVSPDNAQLIFLSKRYFGLFRCDPAGKITVVCRVDRRREETREYRDLKVVEELWKYGKEGAEMEFDRCIATWIRSRKFRDTISSLFKDKFLQDLKWYYRKLFVGLDAESYVREALEITTEFVYKNTGVLHTPFLSTAEWVVGIAALIVEEPYRNLGVNLPLWLFKPECCIDRFRPAHYRANRRIRFNWLVDLMLAEPKDLVVCRFTEVKPSSFGKVLLSKGKVDPIVLTRALAPDNIAKYIAFDIVVVGSPEYEKYVNDTCSLIWQVYTFLRKIMELPPMRYDSKPIEREEEFQAYVYNELRKYITIQATDIPETSQLRPLISRIELAKMIASWGPA